MSIQKRPFGKTQDGKEATLYVIQNQNGMSIAVTDYGATLVEVWVPDKNQTMRDVVLGYDDVSGYEGGNSCFGATIGRNANRIGGASFKIGDTVYELEKNEKGNNLHSGSNRSLNWLWNVEKAEEQSITFSIERPDGDQGFPGACSMKVIYTLLDDNAVQIAYDAVADKDTVMNFTNHSYFNLDGQESGDVLRHKVKIYASEYTKVNAESIPTGEIASVEGTPMDFRTAKCIGDEIDSDFEELQFAAGYDHNWVLQNHGKFAKIAVMEAAESGIRMEVYTDLPGVQFYAGNWIEKSKGKRGAIYDRRQGACFETQYFPDAVNKPQFPSPIYPAGTPYRTMTIYRFL